MKNLKQFNEFVNESNETENENIPVEINNEDDFINHYTNVYDAIEELQNILIGTYSMNFEHNHKKRESEDIAVEDFYDNVVLVDEEEGYIKLNVSKEEVLEYLLNILTN
jgi:hypothetical protein